MKTSRVAIGRWADATREVLRHAFVQQVGILTVANAVGAMSGAVQVILVARWLGPELLGVAALVAGYPGLVHSLLAVKAKEACVKYLSEFHARGEGARAATMCRLGYTVDGSIALLALVLVSVSSGWAGERVIRRPDLIGLLILHAASFVPHAFVGTSQAVLVTRGRFHLVALLETLSSVLRAAASIALVGLGCGVAGIIWGNVIASLAAGAGYAVAAHRLMVRDWQVAWTRARWSALSGLYWQITRFFLYTDASLVISAVSREIDVLLIGYFRDTSETGLYKIARSLSGAVGHVTGPLFTVTYVRLSGLWALRDLERVRQQVRRLHRTVGLPLGVVVASSTLVVPWVLPTLVGLDYAGAVLSAQILLVSTALGCVFFWIRPSYMATNAIHRLVRISSVGGMVLIVGLLVGVRSLGHVGAALAVLGREVLEVSWAATVLTRHGPLALAQARSRGVDGRA